MAFSGDCTAASIGLQDGCVKGGPEVPDLSPSNCEVLGAGCNQP